MHRHHAGDVVVGCHLHTHTVCRREHEAFVRVSLRRTETKLPLKRLALLLLGRRSGVEGL